MKQRSKRLLSILLTLVMLLGMVPGVAWAAGTGTESDPILVGTADEIKNAWTAIKNASAPYYVKLTNNIDLAEALCFGELQTITISKTMVLDLNGHSININNTNSPTGINLRDMTNSLTITDNSEGTHGTVQVAGDIGGPGNLTLTDGVTLSCRGSVRVNNLNISGGAKLQVGTIYNYSNIQISGENTVLEAHPDFPSFDINYSQNVRTITVSEGAEIVNVNFIRASSVTVNNATIIGSTTDGLNITADTISLNAHADLQNVESIGGGTVTIAENAKLAFRENSAHSFTELTSMTIAGAPISGLIGAIEFNEYNGSFLDLTACTALPLREGAYIDLNGSDAIIKIGNTLPWTGSVEVRTEGKTSCDFAQYDGTLPRNTAHFTAKFSANENSNYTDADVVEATAEKMLSLKVMACKITREDVDNRFASLSEAFAAAQSGETIVLLRNLGAAEHTGTIALNGGVYTLDLAGHIIDGTKDNDYNSDYMLFRVNQGATLNLVDSDDEKSGGVRMNDPEYLILMNNGAVNIEGGSYYGGLCGPTYKSEGPSGYTNITPANADAKITIREAWLLAAYENNGEPASSTDRMSVTEMIADGFLALAPGSAVDEDFDRYSYSYDDVRNQMITHIHRTYQQLLSVDIKKDGASLGNTVPQVGDELTADADGATPVAFQWYRDETPIEGANTATYTVAAKDAGCILCVRATQAPLEAGQNENVKSDNTEAVFAAAKNLDLNKHYPTLQAAFDDASLADGDTVQLLTDVTENVTLETMHDTTGKSVTLDLNGNSVKGNDENSNRYVITVLSGSLTLKDSGTGGKITNLTSGGGAVSVWIGATFIMKGGSLCNNKPTSNNCTVNVQYNGTFIMEGGAIEHNESTATTGCGVYLANGSTFTMTGGKITNNTGLNSVGVYAGWGSHFTMTGGEISNNVASEHSTGVRVESPNVTFGGTAKVIGNKRSDDKTENVFMLSERVMVSTATPFEDGASVGITLGTQDGKGVFTKDIADDAARNDAKPYFFSDNPEYSVLPATADEGPNQLKLDEITYPTPTANTLTYDGSSQALATAPTEAEGYSITYSSAENGTYSETVPTGKNAGSYEVWYKVDKDNEHYGPTKLTVTISPATVTVLGITADNKTYDGTTAATLNTSGATLTGNFDGNNLTVTGTGAFADANVGDGKTVTISNLALSGSAKDNYVLADEGKQAETTANITPKPVTITAKPQSVEVNGTVTNSNLSLNGSAITGADIEKAVTVSGLLDGHSLSAITLKAVTSAVTTTGTITPESAAVESGGADMTGNYSFTYASGTLTVTPTQPTVTWPTPGEITYGDPLRESALTGGSAKDKKNESKTVEGTFTWKEPTTKPGVSDSGKTKYTIVFTPTDSENYGSVEQEVTITVNKATLTVRADNKTKGYGDDLPELTYSVSGLKDSDKAADVLTGALGCAATKDFAVSGEKGYAINQGTLKLSTKGSVNYSLSFVAGELFVTKKSIKTAVITLQANDIQNTGSAVSPTITSVKLDGKPLSASDYDVSGNSGTENGSYTLTITGKGNYKDAATKVWRIVGAAVPTLDGSLSATDISYGKTLKDSTISGTMKSGGNTVPGTFAWKQPATAPSFSDSNTTRYAVLFTPDDAKNYSSVTLYATLTVNKAPLTVTADAKTRVYGGSNPALTYTVNGLQNGDKAADVLTGALSCAANGTTSVGDADITVGTLALSTAGAINYTFNYTGAKLAITPKSIKNAAISLAASQIGYTGDPASPVISSVKLDGKLLSDSDYVVSGDSGTAQGDYTLTVTGKGNYKDTATAGWKIVADPLTVESTSATAITYGQTLKNSEISGTVKSGETVVEGAFAWARPAIKPSALDSGSTMYAVTFTPRDSTYKPVTLYLSLTVNKATPTGTPSASAINSGDKLSVSRLSGEMKNPYSQVKVPGIFTWSASANPTTTEPPVNDTPAYAVTFTPNDADNYETVTNLSATPTVNKALWTGLTLTMADYDYGTTPPNYSFKENGNNATPYTVQYSTSKNSGWQPWSNQTLDVGTYFLRATKAGDNDHVETETIASFRVKPARYDNPQNPAVTDYTVTVNSADIAKINAGRTLQYAVVKTDSVGDFFIPANQSAVNSENLPTLPYVDAPALSNGTFALRGLQNSTGYTIFFRYKASADGNYLESFSASFAWTTPASYTVVYNANYGTGTVPTQTNSSGSGSLTVASGSALKRIGYTFANWNTKADGTGTTYAAADPIGTGATLYAQWTPINYTLKLYDSDGTTQIGSDIALTYEQVTVLPTPTRDGYTFAGWASSSSATVSTYSGGQTVKNLAATNTTIKLYAVWTENTYALGGNVLSYADSNYVTLKLMRGNAVIDTTTTENLEGMAAPYAGTFSFGPVPAGEYNIVAEQGYHSNISGDSETVTITQHVTITNADEDDIVIEIGDSGVSSIVEVKDDAPPVVVESLEKVAESVAEADKKVELTMTVEKQEEQELPEDATDLQKETQDAIKDIKGKESADTTFDFLDITLEKATQKWETGSGWSEPENERMRSTDEWVGVTIPYDFTGKSASNFVLYRSHNGQSEKMAKLSNPNDSKTNAGTAYFWLDTLNNLIRIYTQRFSTYAIGYTDTAPENNNNNNNNNSNNNNYTGGGGGGSDSSYPVTVGQTANGTVKADRSTASAGTRVTVTATPNSGCKVDSVTVTDKNGKTVPVTRNSDGTYRFNMPESAVTVNVTFAKKFADPADTGVADWLNTDDHILYIRGYNEKGVSTVRPDNNITRAEAAMMFYRLLKNQDVTVTKTFTDVSEGQWYAQPIGVLASLGIVGGYGDGTFLPNRTITRAEFAKIATRFAIATGGKAQFSDVPEGHWAGGFIATAADYGWIGGYEDGTYRPDGFMTRAAAAKIINYMLGRSADREYVLSNRDTLVKYTDLTDPNVWYYFELVEASVAHDFTVTDGVEKWK